MSRSPSTDWALGAACWVIVVALLLLGYLSLFTIGRAFWLMAVAMIVLSPFRSRPRLWWSGMALVAGYLIGYVAVAPWGCSQSAIFDPVTDMAEKSQIVCRSLIGIEYTGPDGFDPSSASGVIAGAVLGAVAALAIWARLGAGQAAGGS